MSSDDALECFAKELTALDSKSLWRAGLCMSLYAHPQLDLDAYVDKLALLAQEVGALDVEPVATIQALFGGRLRGNESDYYDVRNSFLSEVLDRRLGIPISLAVVGIAVGQRLGLEVFGVPFPGHFLLAVRGPEAIERIDPFAGGVRVTDEELLIRLRTVTGRLGALGPAQLGPATPRQILSRMLLNLKQIYIKSQSIELALEVQERLLMLNPSSPHERRDRGLLYARVGRQVEAEVDLVGYLDSIGDAGDAEAVSRILEQVRRNRGPAN